MDNHTTMIAPKSIIIRIHHIHALHHSHSDTCCALHNIWLHGSKNCIKQQPICLSINLAHASR